MANNRNSIKSSVFFCFFFSFLPAPSRNVRLLLIITKTKGAKLHESKETVVYFDGIVVEGSAWTKQGEQTSSSENTVQEIVSGRLLSKARIPVPGLTSSEGEKCRGQTADWCSLCLYVNIGSYTLSAPHVFRFTFSPASGMTRKGFVLKWGSKPTRGQSEMIWDFTEGK